MQDEKKQKSILIVDDEEHIVQMLDINIRNQGYRSIRAFSGEAALETVRTDPPDVILLDVMMPGIDGIEVCRRLKDNPATWQIPVIMVSAKSEEQDRINGLEGGADDYVTKPFNLQELFLRIRAALRQVELLSWSRKDTYRLGSLELDTKKYQVTSRDTRIDLTLTEFRILQLLLQQVHHVISRETMIREVFERDPSEMGRSIDVHVRNLRKKLDEAGVEACSIGTVRGVGYVISDKAIGQ